MGLFSKKSKKIKMPPMPSLGKMGEEFKRELYAAIQSGMAGGWTDTGKLKREMLGAAGTAYKEGRTFLASEMNRFVPREDVKLRNFMQAKLGRNWARQKHEIKEGMEDITMGEQQEARKMGISALGGEKKMGAAVGDVYNQGMMDLAQMPDYGSELAGGFGGAAGWMAGQGAFNSKPYDPNAGAMNKTGTYGNMYQPQTGPSGFASLFNNFSSFFNG